MFKPVKVLGFQRQLINGNWKFYQENLRDMVEDEFLERELETTFRMHGLDNGTYDVLATLRRSGAPYELSASALADATMIARSSMTSRIDRLEASGYVTRVDDERGHAAVLRRHEQRRRP